MKRQMSPTSNTSDVWRSSNPLVSVVIPALNEEENLPLILTRLPEWIHEVILVDGNSTDGTVEIARRLCPGIRILHQVGKGKGDALRMGFEAVTGDVVVMLDADGSTDPAEIPAFVQALVDGADFVKGSRFLPGGGTADMPLYRRLGNSCFLLAVGVLFRGTFSDLCYGYNAFWTRVLPDVLPECDGFEVETWMNLRALRAGLRIAEVPSFEAKRVYGESRLRTIPDGWRVLGTIVKEWLRKDAPRRQGPADRLRPVDGPVLVDPDAPGGLDADWSESPARITAA